MYYIKQEYQALGDKSEKAFRRNSIPVFAKDVNEKESEKRSAKSLFNNPTRMNRKEKFLHALPKRFNRQKYLEIAKELNTLAKTAEGYMTSFIKPNLIHREQQGNYINLNRGLQGLTSSSTSTSTSSLA